MKAQIDVALVLWNPDVITVVSMALLQRGLHAAGLEPQEDTATIEELIRSTGSHVVVFDLAPPYSKSGAVAIHLMRSFPSRAFVFTCADPEVALKAQPWLASYRIFRKPYDVLEMAESIAAVRPLREVTVVANARRRNGSLQLARRL